MQEIVRKLNSAKKAKGYTLKRLAEGSGLTLGTVNKIMSGELQKIKPDKLEKLALALDVSVDYLCGKAAGGEREQDDCLGLVKIACISPQVRVGDCDFNTDEIIREIKKVHKNGVKIALFPELCITGYSCGDLFFQNALRQSAEKSLERLCRETAETDVISIVGLPIVDETGKLLNAAAVVLHGETLGIIPKTHLPNYNEFIEKRLFAPFDGVNRQITIANKCVPIATDVIFADRLCPELRFSVEICEDVWVADSPSIRHSAAGANAIFNLSASNETVAKSDYRRKMIEIKSGSCGVIYAYCSSAPSESTSNTVFSAHNIICENGELIAESKPFAECYAEAEADLNYIANERARLDRSVTPDGYLTVYFDLPISGATRIYSPTPFVPHNALKRAETCERAFTILAYGLKKRIEHVKADKLVIGVSGGSDSALSLLICEKALKLLNRPMTDIIAVSMPCFGTSERTLKNSIALPKAIGATVRKIDVTLSVRQHLKDIEHDENVTDVVYENAQARERTQVLMDIANGCNGLVIGTGDLSEIALGWCTYNGDHMSMYAVNSSVPKTLVRAMLKHCTENCSGELKQILLDVVNTPISPELLPADNGDITQITEDVIGPYELHDYFLFMLIRKNFTPSKVYKLARISFASKYTDGEIYKWLKKFVYRFFSQQFKRSCSPDGVRLGSVDISKYGLRMPSDACCDAWIADLERVKPENV